MGCYHLLRDFGLGDEVFLSFLPLSHSYEHTAGQFLPVSLGAQIYYAEHVDKLIDDMAAVRPTLMLAVPRLYEVMHQRIMRSVDKTTGLRRRLFDRALALGRKRYEQPRGLSIARSGSLDRLVDRLVRDKVRAALRRAAQGPGLRRRRAQRRDRPLLHRPRRAPAAGLRPDRDLADRQRQPAAQGEAAHRRPAADGRRGEDRRRRRDPRARRGGHAGLLARSRRDRRRAARRLAAYRRYRRHRRRRLSRRSPTARRTSS